MTDKDSQLPLHFKLLFYLRIMNIRSIFVRTCSSFVTQQNLLGLLSVLSRCFPVSSYFLGAPDEQNHPVC